MAENYVQYIADGLKELHGDLSSQGLIKLGNETTEVNGAPFSWDDLFYYMAWDGLHKTTQFQSDIIEKGKEGAYAFYLSLAAQEGASNKCK